jgi:hypothetical protein
LLSYFKYLHLHHFSYWRMRWVNSPYIPWKRAIMRLFQPSNWSASYQKWEQRKKEVFLLLSAHQLRKSKSLMIKYFIFKTLEIKLLVEKEKDDFTIRCFWNYKTCVTQYSKNELKTFHNMFGQRRLVRQ